MRRAPSLALAGLLTLVACEEAYMPAEGCNGTWVVLQFKTSRAEGLENGTYKLTIENPANAAESDVCEMTKTSTSPRARARGP